VLCIRITYLGELGYELYIPAEQAVHVYDRIVAAGEAFGLRHAGLKALASLRMEKGYRDYGHDIDNTDSVLEAGLGFAVANDKPFLGHEAVARMRAGGPPRRRLVQVLLGSRAALGPHDRASSGDDPQALLFHGEVVHRDGVAVGYVRAASYGHTLGGAVGLAMVEAPGPLTSSWVDSGEWSVDIAGARHAARVSLRPLYDPTNARIRA
jgi:4-methylaminobutanoate oxidase (formaldehyde-forming)